MEDILNFIKRYRYLLAVCSGVFLFCSFPSVNFFPFAWVSLVPLLLVLGCADNWKSAFRIGYVTGLVFFAGLLIAIALLYPYASIFTTALGYLLLVGYTAVYIALFAFFVHRLPWQSGILYPTCVAIIWVSLEWVRGWLLTGFPWGFIGYSQWNYLPGIQIASLTGVYGVSFVIVFFNAGIVTLIRNRHAWRKEVVAFAVPCFLTIATLVYGYVVMGKGQGVSENLVKVALVPGNISQLEKWKQNSFPKIFSKYLNLTEQVAIEGPDIIVWPETTVRGQLLSGEWENYHKYFERTHRKIGRIPMLIGATDPDALGDLYNRVISISSDGQILGKYAKMKLVPFGEYVPLGDFLPNFIQFQPYTHGKTIDILPISEVNERVLEVGTSICFESAFPNHFRQFVRNGADMMGILTNDAWFSGTAFPELHLAMAPFRAVENRIAVFRCANGGYTCAVDRFGHIFTPFVTSETAEEYLVAEIALSDGNNTIYTRFGDWLPKLCFVICIFWIVYRLLNHYYIIKLTDPEE